MTEKPERDREADAELLRVVGHALRLEILSALSQGERAVGDIETTTGIAQPGLSQQLGILRKADLVVTRREGKQVFYALAADRLREAAAILANLAPGAPSVLAQSVAASSDPIHRKGGAAVFARVTK